ncbi:MAG: hypothetical protein HC857_15275 [Synechococcales cyanobacterium RU_4_20]|nr:hypothetical protein [Synechococcales cyanobacterium RU_4_20]
MAADGGGAIAVFKGDVKRGDVKRGDVKRGDVKKGDVKKGDMEPTPADPVTPVYATSNGLAAVPTGQVFVRFAAGVDARDRAAQLQAAGYTTVKVLDFAPQGAWVQAGSIAASLNQLQSLESLENIEIIEPQMLMERSLR